ncbi:MAG: peptidylprolyl isomerase [Campylobacterales bacterium]|nr:peptidylprolyl isomerase [Campylobacterales bacterium]
MSVLKIGLLVVLLGLGAWAQERTAVFQTSQGEIVVELFPQIAPKAVENFVGLAKKNYYDNTVFHRVIKNFMIQGGDPTASGRGGVSFWGEPFEDEFRPNIVFDRPGILAMANAGPNTNGSQFFITTVPTPWLNGRHTIFGEVVEGMDVIRKIERTKVGSGDRPVENQVILSVTIK